MIIDADYFPGAYRYKCFDQDGKELTRVKRLDTRTMEYDRLVDPLPSIEMVKVKSIVIDHQNFTIVITHFDEPANS